MTNPSEFNVLIGLDCLLDYRLGALKLLNPDYVKRVMGEKGNPYFRRVIDDFEWLGKGVTGQVKEILADPTPDLIQASFRTLLVDDLQAMNLNIVLDGGSGPVFEKMIVHVNTWPMQTDAELTEALAEVVSDALSSEKNGSLMAAPDVNIVCISNKDLNFATIKRSYSCVYLYDWTDWLKHRDAEIKDIGNEMICAQVGLHVPALFSTLPDKEKLKLKDGGHMNPFYETKRNLAIWIGLSFENPGMFSVLDPFSLVK